MSLNPRILVFTIVEVAALVGWLILALQATDILTGILAVLVLIGGFTLEHLITYNVVHKRPLFRFSGLPIRQKFVVSIIETGIWVIWLLILRSEIFDLGTNLVIASIFMFATLLVEHTLSDNVFTKRKLFERIFDRKVIGFTVVETIAAGIWIFYALETEYAFVGVIILFIGSFAEHQLAVNLSQRQSNKA